MYVRDEPRNPGDFLYARIPVQQRGLVTVALAPAPTAPLELAGRFDIVLAH
jgi:hypothetical protein